MGMVCFDFRGPDESRVYSVFRAPLGASLAIWLGVLAGGSWL